MKVAALFSGGKDSTYAIYIAQQYGWDVTKLVTIVSENKESWMYHTLNIHLTELQAESMGITLIKRVTKGKKEEELNDLKDVLKNLDINGVISGALASEYQRTRIEKICYDLGIKSFTPLWHKNQELILREQVNAGFKAVIVGVFAKGFDETWLGRNIDDKCVDELVKICDGHKINVAGEGGEFETLVLDCPLFKKRLVLDDVSKEWNRDNGIMLVKKAHLTEK
ncbi:MAG: TIGR00289 family protein [Candidatus Thermoplasmatota archaeon]|jgi:predicted ATP pyrophosphatase (TIGR00289 family)|nr:TIGR00289 family protein [Candidatus Thermoplasmatota archaeon]